MDRFKDIGEFDFIDRIAAHAQRNRVLCGIGDDCAVMAAGQARVRLVTVDAMVEGVHFVPQAPPEGVGYKLLAASLSDVAAMGGKPTDAVVAVSASGDCDVGYVERIYNGLFACADRFDVAVVGGDTTRTSGALVLSLTLTGELTLDQADPARIRRADIATPWTSGRSCSTPHAAPRTAFARSTATRVCGVPEPASPAFRATAARRTPHNR